MQSKIVLTTLMASAVSASHNFMLHPQMKRDLLAPRQTGGLMDEECQSAIMEVFQSVPTPAPAILEDITENPQTDPCKFSTPASLSKEYASYSSEIMSWYSKNEDNLSSAIEACPILSEYATMVPVCSGDAGAGSGGKKTEATKTVEDKPEKTDDGKKAEETDDEEESKETSVTAPKQTDDVEEPSKTPGAGSGSGDDDDEEDDDEPATTNGAARQGGMVLAAVAVAGLVAAVL